MNGGFDAVLPSHSSVGVVAEDVECVLVCDRVQRPAEQSVDSHAVAIETILAVGRYLELEPEDLGPVITDRVARMQSLEVRGLTWSG